jgi:hypothetical protein
MPENNTPLFEDGYIEGWNKDPALASIITGITVSAGITTTLGLISATGVNGPIADKLIVAGLTFAAGTLIVSAGVALGYTILDKTGVLALGELNLGLIQDNLSNYDFKKIFNDNDILKKHIVSLPFIITKFNNKDENGNIIDEKMLCYYYDNVDSKIYFIDKIQAPNGKVIYDVTDNETEDLKIGPEQLLIRIINNSIINNNNKFIIANNSFENTDSKLFNININIKHSGHTLLFNKPAIKGTKGHTGGKHSMLGNRRR